MSEKSWTVVISLLITNLIFLFLFKGGAISDELWWALTSVFTIIHLILFGLSLRGREED